MKKTPLYLSCNTDLFNPSPDNAIKEIRKMCKESDRCPDSMESCGATDGSRCKYKGSLPGQTMSDKPEKIEWLKPEITFTYGMVGGEEFFRIHKTNLEVLFVANHHHSKKGDYGKRWHECETVKDAKDKAEELLAELILRADLVKPSEELEELRKKARRYKMAMGCFDDYRAENNALLVRIKELEKAKPSEWISVDDRLPEDMLRVLLVTNPRGEVGIGRRDEDNWCDDYHGYVSVTHWQPLPAPPTRETP